MWFFAISGLDNENHSGTIFPNSQSCGKMVFQTEQTSTVKSVWTASNSTVLPDGLPHCPSNAMIPYLVRAVLQGGEKKL